MSTEYECYLRRKRAEHGAQFDPSELDQRFVPFYGTETRIMVEAWGELHYGRVGVTTGWKPVFLLMHNRRCSGSSHVLRAEHKILAVTSGHSGQYIYYSKATFLRACELRRKRRADRSGR